MTVLDWFKNTLLAASIGGILAAAWVFVSARALRASDPKWRDDPRLQIPWIRLPGQWGLRDLLWGRTGDLAGSLRWPIWLCRGFVAVWAGALLALLTIKGARWLLERFG